MPRGAAGYANCSCQKGSGMLLCRVQSRIRLQTKRLWPGSEGSSPPDCGIMRQYQSSLNSAKDNVQGEERCSTYPTQKPAQRLQNGAWRAGGALRCSCQSATGQMAAAGLLAPDEEIFTSVLAGLPTEYDILATRSGDERHEAGSGHAARQAFHGGAANICYSAVG